MSTLAPLETLYEVDRGSELPLPAELRDVYGRLAFPPQQGRPYVIGNFVTTVWRHCLAASAFFSRRAETPAPKKAPSATSLVAKSCVTLR